MSNITAGKAQEKLIYCSRLNNALNKEVSNKCIFFQLSDKVHKKV